MAIEDGVVLARCLSNYTDAEVGFRAYERLRYSRTALVTRLSLYYGRIGQWSNPSAAWLRNRLIAFAAATAGPKSSLKFAKYDAGEVLLPATSETRGLRRH